MKNYPKTSLVLFKKSRREDKRTNPDELIKECDANINCFLFHGNRENKS